MDSNDMTATSRLVDAVCLASTIPAVPASTERPFTSCTAAARKRSNRSAMTPITGGHGTALPVGWHARVRTAALAVVAAPAFSAAQVAVAGARYIDLLGSHPRGAPV